jgi:ankyrin repeat protein
MESSPYNYSWSGVAKMPDFYFTRFYQSHSNKLLSHLTQECDCDEDRTIKKFISPVLKKIGSLPFTIIQNTSSNLSSFFRAVANWEGKERWHTEQLLSLYLKAIYQKEEELVEATSELMHGLLSEKANKIPLDERYLQNEDEKALMVYCEEGMVKEVQQLIQKGVNLNTREPFGLTPLHVACLKNHVAIVKVLLESKQVNIDAQDLQGCTPLIFSAFWDRHEAASLLIKYNASQNLQSEGGTTAAMAASQRNSRSVLEILANSDANLQIQDKSGSNCFDHAYYLKHRDIEEFLFGWGVEHGTVVQIFQACQRHDLDHVHSLFPKLDFENLPLVYRRAMLKSFFDIEEFVLFQKLWHKDLNPNEYLSGCVLKDCGDLCTFLIGKGADINRLFLSFCVKGNSRMVKLALKYGADIYSQDEKRKLTGLIYAAAAGKWDIVQFLLQTEPNLLNLQDQDGRTALMWALKKKQIAIADYLIDAGAGLDGAFELAVKVGIPSLIEKLTHKLFPEG